MEEERKELAQELINSEKAQEKPKKEELRQILEEEFKQDVQKCSVEINAALDKYNLALDISTVLHSNGRVNHMVNLVRKEKN